MSAADDAQLMRAFPPLAPATVAERAGAQTRTWRTASVRGGDEGRRLLTSLVAECAALGDDDAVLLYGGYALALFEAVAPPSSLCAIASATARAAQRKGAARLAADAMRIVDAAASRPSSS